MALLTQRNMAEAARVAGVGATTLHRWRQEAEFAAAFRAARLEAFGQASARLQAGGGPGNTSGRMSKGCKGWPAQANSWNRLRSLSR